MMLNDEMPPLLSMEQLQEGVRTLSTAFEDDPLWLYTYPERQKR